MGAPRILRAKKTRTPVGVANARGLAGERGPALGRLAAAGAARRGDGLLVGRHGALERRATCVSQWV